MLTEWLLVGLGVLLTAGTAVFVAAEFALVTLDPGLVDRDLAGQQDIRTRSVRKALRQLSTQLSGAQVGITVTTILLGYTAQPALATLLTGPLDSTPLARQVTVDEPGVERDQGELRSDEDGGARSQQHAEAHQQPLGQHGGGSGRGDRGRTTSRRRCGVRTRSAPVPDDRHRHELELAMMRRA